MSHTLDKPRITLVRRIQLWRKVKVPASCLVQSSRDKKPFWDSLLLAYFITNRCKVQNIITTHQHVNALKCGSYLQKQKSERALRYTLTVLTHYTVNTRWFLWSSINLLAGGSCAEMLLRQIFSSLPPQSAMSVHKI